MKPVWLGIVGAVLPALLAAEAGAQTGVQADVQTGRGILIAKTTVEILTLRPTLSLGLGSPARE